MNIVLILFLVLAGAEMSTAAKQNAAELKAHPVQHGHDTRR